MRASSSVRWRRHTEPRPTTGSVFSRTPATLVQHETVLVVGQGPALENGDERTVGASRQVVGDGALLVLVHMRCRKSQSGSTPTRP
jgi:uncharacterized Rossmann fold enzyme